MIKVSVFYPYQPNARFDMTYYCDQHMPLVLRLLGPAAKNVAVDQGLSGGTPGSTPLYAALRRAGSSLFRIRPRVRRSLDSTRRANHRRHP
jgi:uncharacterized protein (TIGR02118 family)